MADTGEFPERSFTAFVETQGDRLRAAVARDARLRPAEVDDVLQETFAALLPVFAGLHDDDVAFRYARVIARNVVNDVARDTIRRRAQPWLHAAHLVHDHSAVADPADAAMLDVMLRAAVCALPEKQRVALVLVDLLDVAPAEAAARMGVPATALKGLLQRARASVRAALAQGVPPPDHPSGAAAGGGPDACPETANARTRVSGWGADVLGGGS